ncbi:MAG: hypothetical protein DWH91_10290 [Planctomycetota bacterium]|nr:MAG: hypothetical protein DWH91_10290 [Planctomycetota bacterium]
MISSPLYFGTRADSESSSRKHRQERASPLKEEQALLMDQLVKTNSELAPRNSTMRMPDSDYGDNPDE